MLFSIIVVISITINCITNIEKKNMLLSLLLLLLLLLFSLVVVVSLLYTI